MTFAQTPIDSSEIMRRTINESFKYQTGSVNLKGNIAKLNVPKGFKYLDPEQSNRVLTEIWGNPKTESSLGMLFPENAGPADESTFAFNITFDDMGYVKDEDADDINYDDLLTEMQKEAQEASEERKKQNFPAIEIVGWASKPYYDKEKHTLHWAKELKFGDEPAHTLNYNIRLLGREGVLELNAIGGMDQLNPVKQHVNQMIASIEFSSGKRYSDFNPSIDKVAAYTIGGLVAGKILAKVGFFVVILKFWKLIALGFIGLGSLAWRFLMGRKTNTPAPVMNTTAQNTENNSPENNSTL